ncbi:hypothetical protein BpHYR1_054015 [Brachionus plicatilis]|uniref:Uncharacterized protein n=1 Tax=Brachionus plicatilis TaxID=10195 RepID=A0A3M7PUI0_BRAPC|nr:hypothetical protein BpHYR1_054015 [Brachionus plicatilis]
MYDQILINDQKITFMITYLKNLLIFERGINRNLSIRDKICPTLYQFRNILAVFIYNEIDFYPKIGSHHNTSITDHVVVVVVVLKVK